MIRISAVGNPLAIVKDREELNDVLPRAGLARERQAVAPHAAPMRRAVDAAPVRLEPAPQRAEQRRPEQMTVLGSPVACAAPTSVRSLVPVTARIARIKSNAGR